VRDVMHGWFLPLLRPCVYESRLAKGFQGLLVQIACVGAAASWTAPAEHNGAGAFEWHGIFDCSNPSGWWFSFIVLVWSTAGCGSFMARRMAQAPNSYPRWLAPEGPVAVEFSPKMLTNFPRQYIDVGPPPARLCYRVIDPADYRMTVTSTNWMERGRKQYAFTFHAEVPGPVNAWSPAPRGTVVLLHGYGLAQFAMAPWALRLAQDGWRCVLVDLRGHGRSTGKRIYYGTRETHDLSQLLDRLAEDGQLKEPVAAFGESYGAALALRWKTVEPRVRTVVAITPYAGLSNAVLNLCHEYAGWVPRTFLRAGMKKLPSVLEVPAEELDTTTELVRSPVTALFVAAAEDKITPVADVKQLQALAAPGSKLIVVPEATHEAVTYFFADLAPPVLAWLAGESGQGKAAGVQHGAAVSISSP
jgi:pimeloyl-ACP methyl ester carboxylesterase